MANGNAFAAGIFLGTGLIHLLPEAERAWASIGIEYPMAPLLAVVGFLLLLLIEHVLLPGSAHEVVHAHAGEPMADDALGHLASGPIPYALLLALSVHSLIAGLALGAQTSAAGVSFTFLAIILHKGTETYALGISLARSHATMARAKRMLAAFVCVTPIGIALGALAALGLPTVNTLWLDAIVLALAAGTFVYIAAVDILQDELLATGGRFEKWLAATVAVAITAILSLWI